MTSEQTKALLEAMARVDEVHSRVNEAHRSWLVDRGDVEWRRLRVVMAEFDSVIHELKAAEDALPDDVYVHLSCEAGTA